MTRYPVTALRPVDLSVSSVAPAPAVSDSAEELSRSAKVRQEFLGILITQLMKDGFMGGPDSALFGDGPQSDFLKTLMSGAMAKKLSESPAFRYEALFPEDR